MVKYAFKRTSSGSTRHVTNVAVNGLRRPWNVPAGREAYIIASLVANPMIAHAALIERIEMIITVVLRKFSNFLNTTIPINMPTTSINVLVGNKFKIICYLRTMGRISEYKLSCSAFHLNGDSKVYVPNKSAKECY